jgi:DNA-binding IclR family transcriptional regulator
VGELEREIARIRARGYATNVGELEEGLHAVAAPVLDSAGRCHGALSISGPSYRMAEEALPGLGELCCRAADEIGSLLHEDARAA